ncbi:MAG: TolC family protein [Sphaerochaeta sp.]|nr:TolC family protein [Sphaerochaeta sp.]
MIKKRTILILLVCMCILVPIGAEILPLDRAVSLAMENVLAIRSAELTKTKALQVAETNELLPSLGVSYSFNQDIDPAQATFGDSTHTAKIALNWSLSGSSLLQKKERAISKSSAQFSYDSTVDEIISGITTQYWNLAASRLSVESASTNHEAAEESYNQVLELYEASRATSLQLAQAKMYLRETELDLKQIKDEYEQAKLNFLENLGLSSDYGFELEEMPVPQPLKNEMAEELVAENLTGTTAVQQAFNSLEVAVIQRKAAILNARVPQISTSLGYSFLQNGSNLSSQPVQLSVAISIPLDSYLPTSSTNSAIKNTAIGIAQAELGIQMVKQELQREIRNILTTIGNTYLLYQSQQEYLDMARETLGLTTEAYEVGLSTLADYNAAKRDAYQAEISLVARALDYLLACYDLADLLDITYETVMRSLI